MSRTVLCVVPYFPPFATSGTHRIRAATRYLPEFGWQPVVVTPRTHAHVSVDPNLLVALPEDLPVYRTPAPDLLRWTSGFWSILRVPVRTLWRIRGTTASKVDGTKKQDTLGWLDWASRWLQTPDQSIGWLPWGVWTAYRAVQRHRCQAIYSSAPFWTTHLVALALKRLTGLPWVAGFRDPWRASPFRQIPYKSVDWFDAWLEQLVIQESDRVIANTDPARRQFMRRYPALADKFVVIPNGFDPEDFAQLTGRRKADSETLVITHAGQFYGPRKPDSILQAIALLQGDRDAKPTIRLQLVGPPTYEGQPLWDIAAKYGVEGIVDVLGEVSHRQALEWLRGSDIQLLVGFGGPGADLQVPAKLYEYFGIGRPVLALAPDGSAIASLMTTNHVQGAICDPDAPEQIAAAIAQLAAERDRSRADSQGILEAQQVLKRFHRREQIKQLAELLDNPHAPSGCAAIAMRDLFPIAQPDIFLNCSGPNKNCAAAADSVNKPVLV